MKNNTIFFLVILCLSASPLILHQVYANHISGQDDIFRWREHDNDPVDSVWCTFDGKAPITDRVSLQCEGGVFNGTTRSGAIYIMKVFDKADIQNVGGSNVFTWTYDVALSTGAMGRTMAIMDGAYDYKSLTEPGGFPANIDYQSANVVGCTGALADWDTTTVGALCLGNTNTDTTNIFGAGSLITAGNTSPSFSVSTMSNTVGAALTTTATVTNALWLESTQSQITVFLVINNPTGTNVYISPRDFSITNTPLGTMTWNFPETTTEANNWDSYLGYNYEQNATESDHGYFYSYDPFVPNPPTSLSAVVDTSDIDLDWEAPTFTGYAPIVGYKIERETPVGGGFSVIVANTGSTNTFASDSTIVIGQEYNYRVSALNTYGSSIPSNESVDGNPPASSVDTTPDYDCPSTNGTFELFIKAITSTSIGLCWDEDENSASSSGYQINYTSPYGDPLTVITNDTSTNATRTYLALNLQPSTQYSFQIQAWPKPIANQTNIANATTLPGEFTIGDFSVNAGVNPNKLDWVFTKTLLNSTQTQLDVDFTNTLDPSCNFTYEFSNANQTYSNLTSSAISSTMNRTTFVFNGVQNDIITVRCYDGESEGKYIIVQESFPLIELIQNFRNGTYGTTGQIGAFDLISLIAIILSMIGFNRVNAGAGAIFTVITIGALATLNIISWPVIVLSAVALVVMLAIIVHSRDDVSE